MEKKKDKKWIVVILLLCFYLLSLIGNLSYSYTYAEDSSYTAVLEDLHKDDNFKEEDYPLIEDDYSLKVIQIAESEDKELFVYVYQPSGTLQATSINISTGIDEDLNYENYKLKLLNFIGVFYKYKVEDLVVKNVALRYYDISSIYREFNSEIDNELENDNEISEIAYSVSKLYTVFTVSGKTYYDCCETETITITDKYVGFIRYSNGFILYNKACDSHYVAFSTDKQIDSLLEADVYYTTRTYKPKSGIGGGGMLLSVNDIPVESNDNVEYGSLKENYVSLKYDDVVDETVGFIYKRKYSWTRIESVEAFRDSLSNNDITLSDDTKQSLQDKQWVLKFAETDYKYTTSFGIPVPSYAYSGTQVTDVTILRLKFETDGKVYNLGVIDTKQSGDGKPDNKHGKFTFLEFLKSLFYGFVVVGLVVLLIVFAPAVFPFLFKCVVWIIKGLCYLIYYFFKGLWWFITLPFEIFKD